MRKSRRLKKDGKRGVKERERKRIYFNSDGATRKGKNKNQLIPPNESAKEKKQRRIGNNQKR
jgi:hypothetical protein